MAEQDNMQLKKAGAWQGVDYSVAPHLLKPEVLAAATNVVTRRGVIEARKGFRVRGELSTRRLLGGDLMVTALVRFDDMANGGSFGDGDNIAISEPTDPTEDYNHDDQEPGEEGDEEPLFPDDWPPDLPPPDNGGFGGGGGGQKKEIDPFPVPDPDEIVDEPDYPPEWIIEASLPSQVYWHCTFELWLTAKGKDGTYDGAGASLKIAMIRLGRNGNIESLDTNDAAVDITSGWSDNQWEDTIKLTGTSAVTDYYPCRVGARADIDGEAGLGDNATMKLPAFPPTVKNFALTSPFTLEIDCEDENGSLLSNYDNSGAGLKLTVTNKQYGGILKTVDETHDAIDSGWSSSEWSGSIDISNLDNEAYKIFFSVWLFNYYQWEVTRDLWPTVINEKGDNYICELVVRIYSDDDVSHASLDWWGYSKSSSSWQILNDPPKDKDGNALDLTSGWTSSGSYRQWKETVDASNVPDDYKKLYAVPKHGGTERQVSNDWYPSCEPDTLASHTTNEDDPIWDLTPYQGDNMGCAGARWRLLETGDCVHYDEGDIDENGKLVGLPDEFESDYSYDGLMEIQQGCADGTGGYEWPGSC